MTFMYQVSVFQKAESIKDSYVKVYELFGMSQEEGQFCNPPPASIN